MLFDENLHQILSKPMYLNPNNFKVFGSMKTKELKQDSQNRLMSPMHEGEILSFNYNYMT